MWQTKSSDAKLSQSVLRIGRSQSGMAFPRGIFCRLLRLELPEQEQKTILKITDELELED